MSIQNIKNSIVGGLEVNQLPNTSKFTRRLINGGITGLYEKYVDSHKNKAQDPLALPVGLTMGLMVGGVYPAMTLDRVGNS